ncbi:MAG: glycoside hydrolase family 88 protein [Chitinophagaceae bacterium]
MKTIIICLMVFFISADIAAQPVKLKRVFADVAKQMDLLMRKVDSINRIDSSLVSPRTLEKGQLRMVASRDWTSGFYPGELWYLYEYTNQRSQIPGAKKATSRIERERFNRGTHDMGFKIYNSVGAQYRLLNDQHSKDILIQSARTLSGRFNKTAGVIRSWDHNRDKWDYPVIIDNMLNLELLFAATKISGDSSFYQIAVSHANNTMKNHFRRDNSCYHVVDYDTVTGKPIIKTTHQGFSSESAWSRGQAWAVYGFTMCYRFTGDTAYLSQAEKTAAFMLHHPDKPADGVPYWDYNAPAIPNEERDVSAAAVLASALYELAGYSKVEDYRSKADLILHSLTNFYRSPIGWNDGFILLHSTGSKPAVSEVDVPLIYADYYYLEALLRSRSTRKYTSTSWK